MQSRKYPRGKLPNEEFRNKKALQTTAKMIDDFTSSAINEKIGVKESIVESSNGLDGNGVITRILDIGSNVVTGSGGLRSIMVKTAILNPNRILKERILGGDRVDYEAISRLLLDETVAEELIKVMTTPVRLREILDRVFYSSNGQVATNSDTLTFEDVKSKLLAEKLSEEVSYIIANILTQVRFDLKIGARSYDISYIEALKPLIPTRESLVQEIKYVNILQTLKNLKIDYEMVGNKRKVGVSDIASQLERGFYPFVLKYNTLGIAERDLDLILVLVKAYLDQDYSSFKSEELYIFQEPKFQILAQDFTIIRLAQATTTNRPLLSESYWVAALERIGATITSSDELEIFDLQSFSQFYTLSFVESNKMRKIAILSRNIVDNETSKFYHYRKNLSSYETLYPDIGTENVFGNLLRSIKSLNSQMIHKLIDNYFIQTVKPEMNPKIVLAGVDDEELKLLAITMAKELYINKDGEFSYGVDLENVNVSLPTGSLLKKFYTTNEKTVLLYGSEYTGSKHRLVELPKLDKLNGRLFINASDVLISNLDERYKFSLTTKKHGTVWFRLKLSKLAGLPSLDHTLATMSPSSVQVHKLLMSTYIALNKFSASSDSFMVDAMLLSTLKTLISSEDINILTTNALHQVWSENDSTLVGHYGSSTLNEQEVLFEIKIRVMFFILHTFGLVTDEEEIKVLTNSLNKSSQFDRYLNINSLA